MKLSVLEYSKLFCECFPNIQLPIIGLLDSTDDCFITELPYNPNDLVAEENGKTYLNIRYMSTKREFNGLLPSKQDFEDFEWNWDDLKEKLLSKDEDKDVIKYFINKYNRVFINFDDVICNEFIDFIFSEGENWGKIDIVYDGEPKQHFSWLFKNPKYLLHKSHFLYVQFLYFAHKNYTYYFIGKNLKDYYKKEDKTLINQLASFYKEHAKDKRSIEKVKHINGGLFLFHHNKDKIKNASMLLDTLFKVFGINSETQISLQDLLFAFYLHKINRDPGKTENIQTGKKFISNIFAYNYDDIYWPKPGNTIYDFMEADKKRGKIISAPLGLFFDLMEYSLESFNSGEKIYEPLQIEEIIKRISGARRRWYTYALRRLAEQGELDNQDMRYTQNEIQNFRNFAKEIIARNIIPKDSPEREILDKVFKYNCESNETHIDDYKKFFDILGVILRKYDKEISIIQERKNTIRKIFNNYPEKPKSENLFENSIDEFINSRIYSIVQSHLNTNNYPPDFVNTIIYRDNNEKRSPVSVYSYFSVFLDNKKHKKSVLFITLQAILEKDRSKIKNTAKKMYAILEKDARNILKEVHDTYKMSRLKGDKLP